MKRCLWIVLTTLLVLPLSGGVNWKTVWMEPNPVILDHPGASVRYVVKGIAGPGWKANLTGHYYLAVWASDREIVEVDTREARLVAKSPGRAEVRFSFSGVSGVAHVTVKEPLESAAACTD